MERRAEDELVTEEKSFPVNFARIPVVETRRVFCGRACQALSVAALGGALGALMQGCGAAGGSPTSSGSAERLPVVAGSETSSSVVVQIDASSPLATVGGVALVESQNNAVLVIRTSDTAFTALSGTCTHQACTITGYASGTFVCPCHGSEFNTNGQVLSGPAFAPLPRYNTQFAGNVLTITG
jgi:cytochrome b6-f complex iron-sulfur subunit